MYNATVGVKLDESRPITLARGRGGRRRLKLPSDKADEEVIQLDEDEEEREIAVTGWSQKQHDEVLAKYPKKVSSSYFS